MRRWLNILTLCLAVSLVAVACAESVATTVETDAEPETSATLATGRDALASVEGEPHVLWFWGAH